MKNVKQHHAGNRMVTFDLETAENKILGVGTMLRNGLMDGIVRVYDKIIDIKTMPKPSILEHEIIRAGQSMAVWPQILTDDEYRWALAFRVILGCGEKFYECASLERRRQLEAHHIERATHDTPKGRKSAKVIAMYTRFKLEGRTREWSDIVMTGQKLHDLARGFGGPP